MADNRSPVLEMTELEFFCGVWEGDGAWADTPFSPALSQPLIRVEAAFRHGGHFFEQRFTWIGQPAVQEDAHGPAAAAGTHRMDLGEATRIWGYDSAERRFVFEWFDSHGQRATLSSPGWEGDRLVTTGFIAAAGRKLPFRETFRRRSDREWHRLGQADFGHGWVQVDEQKLQRVPTS